MKPDNILCFAGAEEDVYAAMRVLLSQDDHFRIGFGRANMDEGLMAFRRFIDRNHNVLAP